MRAMAMGAVAVIAAAMFTGCSQQSETERQAQAAFAAAQSRATTESGKKDRTKDLSQYSRATFAAGCFWCEEAVFESIKGVAEVISGYAGGRTVNPSYKDVGSGETGHAESVEVYYDSTAIDYPALLRVFFASHDPTQVNGQGPDIGTQYRSVVFYRNAEEKRLATQYIAKLNNGGHGKPIATQVVAYTKFWQAEQYHQDYVRNNPYDPYVQRESLPRLRRTQERVRELVKTESR